MTVLDFDRRDQCVNRARIRNEPVLCTQYMIPAPIDTPLTAASGGVMCRRANTAWYAASICLWLMKTLSLTGCASLTTPHLQDFCYLENVQHHQQTSSMLIRRHSQA